MRATKKLIHHLMAYRGVDTRLFQSEQEWELADALCIDGVLPSVLERLETRVTACPEVSTLLQSANAAKPEPANAPAEERQQQNKNGPLS